MVRAETADRIEPVGGDVVQLRFVGRDDGTIDGHLLAESIQGLVEFVSAMAKAGVYGEGPAPEVRIRPIQKGSTVFEAVLEWAANNPDTALTAAGMAGGALTTLGSVTVRAIRAGVRTFSRTISDFEILETGNYKVTWSDGRSEEVSPEIFAIINKPSLQVRKAVAKLQAPLSGDASELQVRSAPKATPTEQIIEEVPPAIVADVSDYRAAAAVDAVPEETTEVYADVEAQLRSIDFEGRQWRVAALGQARMATITDSEFMSEVLGGLALHHDDIFRVTIREVTVSTEGKRDRVTWTVTKVVRTREGRRDEGHPAAAAQVD
ncbi:hypothetical protein CELL_01612 [Cellulomonas sp. T2.31MG-18]|uniref:hypothetical protein n=1 Tax=Cellulomonas sp. T2.31MG-18 TaxID=3157619 RepID=UPI0035E52433